jgi:sugar lactone lactonase YvrE
MMRKLAMAGILALLLLLPIQANAVNQAGVLRHFATMPTGLAAEGLAIGEGHFYVGTIAFGGVDGTIVALDKSGAVTKTFTLTGLPIVGQVVVRDEGLFAVACTSFAPSGTSAVVRVDLESGTVTKVATESTCANGLAIDEEGNMFLTNILAGNIAKVTPEGAVSVFASGPLLAAAPVAPGLSAGPNDLTLNNEESALYVTNIGQNTIVKIAINEDGTAGTISKFAAVAGPDGLAFDHKGNLYVTSPFTNGVFVVAPNGAASPLTLDTTHESLSNPSNLAFHGHQLYITSLGLATGTGKISVVTVQSQDCQCED